MAVQATAPNPPPACSRNRRREKSWDESWNKVFNGSHLTYEGELILLDLIALDGSQQQ
jgi:hypothetical protein